VVHQKGRPAARKPFCPNHPESILDGGSLIFPESGVASASVTLRLYQSSSVKKQHGTALVQVQSLLADFGEGAYDADFSHLATGKSDCLTVQVCLRALQGYEMMRLDRGEEAMEAWGVVTDRLIEGLEEMNSDATATITSTVVRWQMSVQEGKGFEHADQQLEHRLRKMASHNIPKRASMQAAMEVVDVSFDGVLQPYREELQKEKEFEARQRLAELRSPKLPRVLTSSPSPERTPLLSPPGSVPWRPTQRYPRRGMKGDDAWYETGTVPERAVHHEKFRPTLMVGNNNMIAPERVPATFPPVEGAVEREVERETFEEYVEEEERTTTAPIMHAVVLKALPSLLTIQDSPQLHARIVALAKEALGARSAALALVKDNMMRSVNLKGEETRFPILELMLCPYYNLCSLTCFFHI